ncbi:aldehyde dehydrogenase family protein [Stratiformator vulcanicus]|uniref:Succinate-semialdehyde dehydrogenase (Acetylating) n=1 Tax=Stratiformator vulcanicus TaxID=2527980 RepID=A0A517QY09_9PLAN|nr:aldehyde dehydrogenase family protein [Stratiformator vulcanicus]QDT36487.1 Succinate-semialdehyde dehydrogenase (acetylating) [Stratiformator vulcanicus]
MNANEQAIRTVVQEVLSKLGKIPANGHVNGSADNGDWGVFQNVDDAVVAATDGFHQLTKAGTDARKAVERIIKQICNDQAEELGRLELEETQVGRLDHKIEKLKIVQDVLGVAYLKPEALTGSGGTTIIEYAPFGVIGAITPVTHSLPTLAGNVINMVAAGNSVVFNPHPSGKNIACEGVRRFNKAIYEETGLTNVITIIGNPTIESAQAIFEHRDIPLLVVTGGPAVARAALGTRKRAIVAGPGNPPVLVDDTADIEKAAKSIIAGAAYDNNLLCIGEKEVFVVDGVFNSLMEAFGRHGAFRLNADQVAKLTAVAFDPPKDASDHYHVKKQYVGKDPAVLAAAIGLSVPANTQLLVGETDVNNPFVPEEQMMPFVPIVRCRDTAEGIKLCEQFEHGFRHTAIVHSKNLDVIAEMGRVMNTTLFCVNGPSTAGLGVGGEGYLSYSIATPTGEGVTTPMTFTRQRRMSMSDELRIL